jgi:hypothetical protein
MIKMSLVKVVEPKGVQLSSRKQIQESENIVNILAVPKCIYKIY